MTLEAMDGVFTPEPDNFVLGDDNLTFWLLGIFPRNELIAKDVFPNKNKVESESAMYRIIFICDENQGRSQMAEAEAEAFRRRLSIPMPVEIISVGINATPHKNNGKPDPTMRAKMEQMGIDMNEKVVSQLTPSMITENTIVVLLTDLHKLPAYVFKQAKIVLANHVGDPSLPGQPLAKDASLSGTLEETRHIAISVVYKLAQAIKANDFSMFTSYFHKITAS